MVSRPSVWYSTRQPLGWDGLLSPLLPWTAWPTLAGRTARSSLYESSGAWSGCRGRSADERPDQSLQEPGQESRCRRPRRRLYGYQGGGDSRSAGAEWRGQNHLGEGAFHRPPPDQRFSFHTRTRCRPGDRCSQSPNRHCTGTRPRVLLEIDWPAESGVLPRYTRCPLLRLRGACRSCWSKRA